MLKVGLTKTMKWMVEEKQLASAFGSGLVAVLATPVLVGFCEECARLLVEPHLEPGEKTVGTFVKLRHLAATPVKMRVTVRSELVEINGRQLRFRIEAYDELEQIAEGEHERFIIDAHRFAKRVAEKEKKRAAGVD